MFDIRVNFKDRYSPDLSCAICKEGRVTLEHILQCPRLPECEARETLKVDSLLNIYVAKPLKRWGNFLKFYPWYKGGFFDRMVMNGGHILKGGGGGGTVCFWVL